MTAAMLGLAVLRLKYWRGTAARRRMPIQTEVRELALVLRSSITLMVMPRFFRRPDARRAVAAFAALAVLLAGAGDAEAAQRKAAGKRKGKEGGKAQDGKVVCWSGGWPRSRRGQPNVQARARW